MKWSDERIEVLRTLWTNGVSASWIAARFRDVSRCAVLGKVYRLRLEQRRTTLRINAAQVGHRRAALRTRPAATHPWRGKASPARSKLRLARRRPAPSPAELRAWEVQVGAKLIPLLELEAGMCRWPIGEPKTEGFGFCGGPRVEGISYCPRHAIAAFRPAARRRR
jgi:GcrA cell cycle regulator